MKTIRWDYVCDVCKTKSTNANSYSEVTVDGRGYDVCGRCMSALKALVHGYQLCALDDDDDNVRSG